MSQSVSRGIRNANPGNIRLSETVFKGEKIPSSDSAFKQFRSQAWGYRAMFVILNTYATKHRLRTIRKMISRWAPPCENDTDRYVDVVSQRAMLDADTIINTQQLQAMLPLVEAMSYMENGQAGDYRAIEQGFELFIADVEGHL